MPTPIYGIPTLDQVPAPIGNVSFASYRGTNLADPVNAQDISSKAYIDAQIAAISNQGAGFTGVITGCGVVWTGLLNFTVAAGTYAINGTTYTLAQTNLTLAAADATNARFDVIAVNTSSAAVVVQGTPANPALIPTVDPATQLYLSAISVPANSTTPGNITNTVLYAENAGDPAEWNSSSSGSTWNLASTNNPHAGTKCIEATSLTGGAYAQLQKGTGTIDLTTQNSLVFYIRSKAAWNSNRSLTIEFLNAGVLVGNALTFREGSYGFVSSNTTSYQQILIPLTAFNVGNTATNQIRFIAAGSGGAAVGFYLDDVSLQAGVSIMSQNFMVWRSTWSAATAYVKNDVVTYNGIGYVALVPNTNSAPSATNTTNWQSFGNPIRPIGFTLDGGGKVLTTGKVAGYQTCPVSGKITGWSIGADAGTCTIQTWKVAMGTAVPAVGNSISTSGVQLSSNTYVRSLTVSDFTNTTVAGGDIFAFNLGTVATATQITFQLEITPQ